MPLLVFDQLYTISRVQQYPQSVFLFGDNNLRKGKKGQAIIRDEPNALGIRTKWLPTTKPEAYFYDSQLDLTMPLVDFDLAVVEELLRLGTTVYFPHGGIGTGLADLENKSPRLLVHMLFRIHGFGEKYK